MPCSGLKSNWRGKEMLKWREFWPFAMVALLCISGCARQEGKGSGTVVAAVGDARLTIDMVPKSIFSYGGQDSLTLLRTYAERWAAQQAMYQYAVKYSPKKREEIERLVEDYRQTLTIADYEEKIVRKQLDTAVRKQEIASFYEANPTHFTLQRPLVRCLSMVVPQGNAQLKELRAVYALREDDVMDRVEQLTFKAGVRPSTYPDKWLTIEELERVLGIDIAGNALAQRPSRWEHTQDSMVYLLSFHEWKESGMPAPLEYVSNEVRAILLNQRRKRLVDSLERSIVEAGRVDGKVKIFAQ